jgi:hypothetical protein
MSDPEVERRHLGKAERDIMEGESRVTRQMLLIERLRLGGLDTTEAENLLSSLRKTLVVWHGHRDEILRELERQNVLHSPRK